MHVQLFDTSNVYINSNNSDSKIGEAKHFGRDDEHLFKIKNSPKYVSVRPMFTRKYCVSMSELSNLLFTFAYLECLSVYFM